LKSAAIIYGRTSSTRFPQKCFAPIGRAGIPLAHWVVRRAARLNVDFIVFATTDKSSDDKLVSSLQEIDLPRLKIFRGNEKNLVQRTIDCLVGMEIDLFSRINGDSPFFPVNEINHAFKILKANPEKKFMSNLMNRTYPYGVAVEVMKSNFYIEKASEAEHDELEHTTQHLYRMAADQITSIIRDDDLQSVSLTIDIESDFSILNNMILNRGLELDSEWKCAI